jgi:glutamate N-acetyltransferase/amino-acid N-acetyltransferase
VLSELGASGAFLDPERVDIAYNGITVCRDGVAALHDELAVQASMTERDIEIVCDLHAGRGEATVRFTDLTHAYIDENMGTS